MNGRSGGIIMKIAVGIVVVGILLVAGVAFMIRQGFQNAKREFPKVMDAKIQQLEKSKKISAEDMALLRDLKGLTERKEASFTGMGLVAMGVTQVAQDDTITSGERKQLIEIRDFMTARNGNVGMKEMGDFMVKHPEMNAAMKEMQDKAKQQQSKP